MKLLVLEATPLNGRPEGEMRQVSWVTEDFDHLADVSEIGYLISNTAQNDCLAWGESGLCVIWVALRTKSCRN